VSIYENRGDYQLIVQHMEMAGVGALQLAFEQLKQRLAKEGLFADKYKKAIPTAPRTIGVVTSPTGAAIRDILKVLNRRFPNIRIIIYPTAVQGDKAAPQIAAAIQTANQRKECDVILLARGGGSLEDLWPFNEEIVARAIFACEIPLVTGIGHEIDFTIADFVADLRAATPSAAAEHVSPDKNEYLQQIAIFYRRFQHIVTAQFRHYQLQIESMSKRLQHPGQRLQNFSQRLDQLEHRISIAIQHRLTTKQQQLSAATQSLQTISPLATLQRGYAIIQNPQTQQIIRETTDVARGDKIIAKLANGTLDCRVENIHKIKTNKT
jgi:exodeoxyribonuclease VII large subunit